MTRTSLTQLEARDAFIARHIGPEAAEQQQMLDVLGYASRAALIDAIVPPGIRASPSSEPSRGSALPG